MKQILTTAYAILFILSVSLTSYSQITTSSLTGIVQDDKGEPLLGATVKATHVPSGSVYGVIT